MGDKIHSGLTMQLSSIDATRWLQNRAWFLFLAGFW